MPAKSINAHHDEFEVKATAESHFSWVRTRLSLERTLMSWIRTAVALIGFGFTIVQFFDRFTDMTGVAVAARPEAPRYFGLALIAAGVLALLISVWQYHRALDILWSGNFRVLAGLDERGMYTPIYAVSMALIFIGLFAFFAVFTRAV
jgi:putative membrane protein